MMVMECFAMRAFHGAAWFADSRNIKGIRFVMLGGPRSISMVNFLFLFDALETVFVERPSLMVAGVQELTIHRVHTQWEFRQVRVLRRSKQDVIQKLPSVRFLSFGGLASHWGQRGLNKLEKWIACGYLLGSFGFLWLEVDGAGWAVF